MFRELSLFRLGNDSERECKRKKKYKEMKKKKVLLI